VSALPGGSAAKLGDRYEDWWTLCRIGDVLQGQAARIRLEPPGAEGVGIEFWVEDATTRSCEQAKDTPASGSWTVRRLQTEGVLASLLPHLVNGHYVRLVLSTQADDFAALSARAAKTMTIDEYREVLTVEQSAGLTTVAAVWNVPEEQTWTLLKRVMVEHLPGDALQRLVHLTYERLVQGDTAAAIEALRGALDGRLQEVLTAPDLWAMMNGAGFPRRLLAGDANVLGALSASVARQVDRAAQLEPSVGLVEEGQVSTLAERLTTGDEQVVVVDGRAGSGKSTLASAAVRELSAQGWFAAAVRMDAVQTGTQTARALGGEASLPDSPAILLEGVAAGSPAVLLVDQLDAVSTYSGRMPNSFTAVSDVLEQVERMPNVKVVLVVRTVDLHEDPRMRRLLADTDRVGRLAVCDLDPDKVRDTLAAAGIATDAIQPETLRLLCVPLHLAVFSRLSPVAQAWSYRTLSELYERYTNDLRSTLEREVGHLDWHGITSTLVTYMSDHEVLRVPRVHLDAVPVLEVNALLSANMLVADGDQIGFFHETLFDYLFARAFVGQGRDLHEFLVGSGQQLFRRAQTRQVLEYLAATDRAEFRRCIIRVLDSEAVRAHLKAVALAVLDQLDPTAEDWLAIEPLAFSAGPFADRLIALLSEPGWFDATDVAGRWELLLADSSTVARAAYQLIWAARKRPERVQALVEPYVGADQEWRDRLRALIAWSLTPALLDFTTTLLQRGDLDDARGPIAVNADFFSILYGVHEEDPAGTAQVLGAYVRRGIVRAAADGSSDPFSSGHVPEHSSGAAELINKVAEQAPREFLGAVLPCVVDISEATATSSGHERLRTGRWAFRYGGYRYGVADATFGGVEDALRALAVTHVQVALELARPLAASDIEDQRFLACRTFGAVGTSCSDEAVDWLLSDGRNLSLGWSDSPRWASRELIAVATRSCSDDRLLALCSHLLDHYPDLERRPDRRPLLGRSQYDLLSAVVPARRNASVTRRLGELERKFALAPPRAPESLEAHVIGPPIADASSEKMSDQNWLDAVAAYTGDETDWTRGVGGAHELAQVLARRVGEDPERFARLALRFGDHTHPAYFSRLIEAIAGKVALPVLCELCEHAEAVAGSAVRHSIAWALRDIADDDQCVLALLRRCADDTDPDRETARTEASSGGYYYGGDLLSAGLNSTRGAAARAIASRLFAGTAALDELIPIVQALASDPILAVRTHAAEAVRALINSRCDVALDLAESLMTGVDIDLFSTPTAAQLLAASLLRQPARFAPHLERVLASSAAEVARHGGGIWAMAALRDLLVEPLPYDVSALPPAARRGAAEVVAASATSGSMLLSQLLADDVREVRAAASHAARDLARLSGAEAEARLAMFLNAPSFGEFATEVVAALNRRTDVLPASAITACERTVAALGSALGDIWRGNAAAAEDVTALLLRLYRQGDDPVRVRCLDVIDGLTVRRAYGLEDKLEGMRG